MGSAPHASTARALGLVAALLASVLAVVTLQTAAADTIDDKLGAAVASLSLVAVKVFLIDQRLTPQFTITPFIGWDAILRSSLTLFVVGIVLAVVTAFFTLRRYLRV